MVQNSYVIYQSKKAAEDTFAAMELANMIFQDVHLEMAQIKSIADAPNEVM